MVDVRPQAQPVLPVVVVAGLHKEQRRRAVLELLAGNRGSVVLHHDLSRAEHGEVVRRVWNDRGVSHLTKVPLVNDCPCCAMREDLLPQLVRIAESSAHRLAIVELWGGSDPLPLVETIAFGEACGRRMEQVVRITGMITAVDPQRLIPEMSHDDPLTRHGLHTSSDDERTVAEALAHQIEYAGVLAAAAGRGTEAQAGMAMLRQLRPGAPIVRLGRGNLPLAARSGFDVAAAAARVDPALAQLPVQSDEDGVATLVWKQRRPLHPARTFAALGQLVRAAQRSRGRFWLANRPEMMLGWDAAGASLTVEDCGPWLACLSDREWALHSPERRTAAALEWDAGFGDRVQLLTFTAEGLDAEGIRDLLDSCLLTDEELAEGEDGWKRLPDAFEQLLDPVA
ncbi:MAG TPA: GTP-binding protein [Actinospica sp.]|jgi:G3E family GTPase|nr:GTP-binding protein [Actinospica sp.]